MGNLSKYGRYLGQNLVRWYAPPLSTLKWTRLCLPNNQAWNSWKQAAALISGSAWGGTKWSDAVQGMVGQIYVNTGASAVIRSIGDYAKAGVAELAHEAEGFNRFNWSLDKVNRKFSFEFYVDSDLEETSPTVIADDSQTAFWTLIAGTGSLSDDAVVKQKGTDSLKINITGAGSPSFRIEHIYGGVQDWSAKEFICLYVYGQNTGGTFQLMLSNSGYTKQLYKEFTDNFTGWRRMVFPFKTMTEGGGSFDYTQIDRIRFSMETGSLVTAWYLDRVLVDVGPWVKTEIYVPDVLDSTVKNVEVSAWNGSAYANAGSGGFLSFDAEDNNPVAYVSGGNAYVMDGTTLWAIYGANNFCGYLKGGRGVSKGYVGGVDAGNIIYSSNYGCKQRVGFAVKIPPDDGQDSSTAGISQMKVKMTVFYAVGAVAGADGEVTYEFENSANQYYGLQNINKLYLILFKGDAVGAIDFLQLDTGLTVTSLTVTADHDEKIRDVTMGFGGVTNAKKMFWGQDTVTNPNTDSDSDGIPDFIEGAAGTTGVEPFVDGGGWT